MSDTTFDPKMNEYRGIDVYTKSRKGRSVAERFSALVGEPTPTGCTEWQGRKFRLGYGLLKVGENSVSAHRLSWFLSYGKDAGDMCVLHRCDNRSCVNPDHLFLGTQITNINDRVAKGRTVAPRGSSHPCAKVNEATALAIYRLWNSPSHPTQKAIADKFGVSLSLVKTIAQGKSWTWLTGQARHSSRKLKGSTNGI